MHLPGEKFLRQFLLHVLPKGFMRIHHYGYLANRVRVKQLEKIRKCLKVAKAIAIQPAKSGYSPATQADISPANILNTQSPEHCPKCKIGFLRLMGEIASECERRRYGELM
ncbi:hypothetical protein MNBD_GAMMA10-3093 [hydrothermal vent metagenome]|uniref:Transposase IS801/IS1294 domain-containing protein n=1 Tax=hydrothermal vent metagenome TaxID=652676 RepID=A0A3B0YAT4_9ZZZZ